MASQDLPHVRDGLLDAGGTASRSYYLFFSGVDTNLKQAQADIATLQAGGGSGGGGGGSIPGVVRGIQSVISAGALPGVVQLFLDGDADNPGNTTYYGTDGSGAKGFYTVASAFLGTAGDITLTVDGFGVTTIDLATVTPTTGGTLQKYGFDAKGRRTQSAAATSDDLTEGTTNLYASLQHVYDRVKAVLVAGSNVTLTPNDPAHTITIDSSGGGGGGVTSFNTRTGAVVATAGDYTFSLIGGTLADTQLPSTRHTATVTSPSGAVTTGTVAMAQIGRILRLASNAPLRVRLYSTVAHQVADQSRPVSVYPPPGSGLLFEGITTVALTAFDTGPVPEFFNAETTVTNAIAYCLEPTTAVSTTATFTYTVTSP